MPIYAFNFGLMDSKNVLRRVITGKVLEYLNNSVIGYREQVTSIRKLDLFTHFNLYFFYDYKVVFEDIEHSNLVRKCNDQIQTRWMEGQCISGFLKFFTAFQIVF